MTQGDRVVLNKDMATPDRMKLISLPKSHSISWIDDEEVRVGEERSEDTCYIEVYDKESDEWYKSIWIRYDMLKPRNPIWLE